MRGARVALLVAALLALAGCKSTDKDKDDKSHTGITGRPKKDGKDTSPAKGPTWLDDVSKLPGTGTSIPKGAGTGDPKNPNFDPKTAAQDALGGRVLDLDGKPARNIFVRIDQVGVAPGSPTGLGIYTKNDGYFFATGFKPGQTYELTAQATTGDGRKLVGSVQTKVPNAILLITLRDDLPPPFKGTDGGVFPPEPKPSDKVGDTGTTPKPPDGWGPTGPTTNGGIPPTIGGTPAKPPSGVIPAPSDDLIPSPKPVKPENVADAPPKEFKPPPVNIPNDRPPPVPKLPELPPGFSPGGKSSLNNGGNAPGKLALIDTLERRWALDSVRPGSLVLVEFITSTCVPCKQMIPVMKDLQSRYGASGLQVAAVLCDPTPQAQRVATASKYGRDNNLNYAVYVEPGNAGSVRDRFDVESYPHAVLLDSMGRVLWKGHPGEREKLEAAIKQNLKK
jgi:thiol-disulfide isomerase/thioredoxin